MKRDAVEGVEPEARVRVRAAPLAERAEPVAGPDQRRGGGGGAGAAGRRVTGGGEQGREAPVERAGGEQQGGGDGEHGPWSIPRSADAAGVQGPPGQAGRSVPRRSPVARPGRGAPRRR